MIGQITFDQMVFFVGKNTGVQNQFSHHQRSILVYAVKQNVRVPISGRTNVYGHSIDSQLIAITVKLPTDQGIEVCQG